ncbi:MAG: carboxypeptidase-like regulatory domain-containing protein [Aquihabitans sp.]
MRDSTGRYSVTGMVAGTRTVTILAYGFPNTVVSSVAIPAVTTLDRALAPAPASPGIKGTITAQATGLPIAGATVRVWLKGAINPAATVLTGADGRFSIPSIPAGSYEVDVIRATYQVRWFGDSLERTGASTVALTTSCTTTPNPAWGDPCATPVSIAMRKP